LGKLHRRKGSEAKLIVVATDEEYKLAQKRFKDQLIVKTGVGGINVLETLKNVKKSHKIVNFGYVGSNVLLIGTEVKVGKCKLYHPNVEYKEPTYKLKGDVMCYTSNDFVLQTNIQEPCVFDMELAYILALGFKNVESIKIVSDNLSLKDYEENVK